MKVKYFSDTDTAYIEFNDHSIAQTKDINENILIDLDEDGKLVSMTIEHAEAQAKISETSYQHVAKPA